MDGEAFIQLHGENYHLRPGYAYLIPAYSTFKTECPETMTKLWIHFTTEILGTMDMFQLFPPAVELKIKDNNKIEELLAELETSIGSRNIGAMLTADSVIRRLIAEFYTEDAEAGMLEKANAVVRFRDVLAYIEKNLDKNIKLATLAKLANLQPNYFSNLFSANLGLPPKQYINRRRVEKAQDLLVTESGNLEDIALMVGFNDVFYFSRTFKKYTGLSPKNYLIQRKLRIT
jgi:YesN/AraC family two-component response regulator